MNDRDRAILSYVGRYRLTFRPTLERIFFQGRNCGNVIQRLRDQGLLHARQGLPGRLSYYQLTTKGATVAGFPRARASAFGPAALHRHIAILWWCCMGAHHRERLEPTDMHRIFGDDAPQGDHCMVPAKGESLRLQRIFVVTGETDDSALVRRITSKIAAMRTDETFRVWLRTKRYSFLVLCEHSQRQSTITRHIKSESLHELALIRVKVAPGPMTIQEALRQ